MKTSDANANTQLVTGGQLWTKVGNRMRVPNQLLQVV